MVSGELAEDRLDEDGEFGDPEVSFLMLDVLLSKTFSGIGC